MPRSTPTIRSKRLGLQLQAMRVAKGWNVKQAAEVLERAESSLSRIENGLQPVRARDLPFILDEYGVEDQELRAALIQLARDGAKKGWWHAYSGAIGDAYLDFISLEDGAERIRLWSPQLVPGLLQTPEYARKVIEAGRIWGREEDVDRAVKIRMERQSVLWRESPTPPRLWTVIDEGVLRRNVGRGTEADYTSDSPPTPLMLDQLRHILDVARKLPHVTVQVLPHGVGEHAGMDGPFSVMDLPGLSPIAAVTSLTSTLYVESPEAVEQHATAFDHLKSAALSQAKSLAYVARMIKEGAAK